jgi:hypothetical protein
MAHLYDIYIAGKITGLSPEQYRPKFEEAERMLFRAGWHPVNPCKLGIPHNWTTEEALPYCFRALQWVNAIYLLYDWDQSQGAIKEKEFAEQRHYDVFFEAIHTENYMEDIKKISLISG